jgi:protein ImuB
MSRMISIWLPHWPIERLKRERAAAGEAPLPHECVPDRSVPDKSVPDDRPFALVGSEAGGLVLTAVNGPSHGEGLSPGLGLADARAICPHLLTAPAAPEKDALALLALAHWSGRYSPSLNSDGADGLWLDATGIPHLFGGEDALLADLRKRLARFGFSARLAIAETLGCAHALARFGRFPQTIVPAGQLKAALAPLPVEALRLAQEVAGLLRRLGLKHIGQLYDLPRSSLKRRFHAKDAAEAVLLRLDQALGIREEPRTPLLPQPHYVARLPFPEPLITADGVAAALDHLAATLCDQLTRARVGARQVMLALYRADGSSGLIEAGFSAPCRDERHLLLLLRDKVATLDLGFGIDLMLLGTLTIEALPLAQTSLVAECVKERAEPLIDRLANRLGKRGLSRLFPRQSHVPERAQMAKDAFAGAPSWPSPAPAKPPRPPLLLLRPEPLEVLAEIPEGPPARFTWRRVTRRVVKAEGPERIAPEWWREIRTPSPSKGEGGDPGLEPGAPGGGHNAELIVGSDPLPGPPPFGGSEQPRPRDYYRIEDEDGRRYWVFHEGLYQESAAPAWFLHGVFG